MKATDFEIMNQMVKDDKDISAYVDQLDFTRNKKGGRVTFGVGEPHFTKLINQAATGVTTHYAIVLVVNKEQFDAIQKSNP